MSIWDGILQGLLQGLTEFLPVSSDGHVTLYQHFTGLAGEGTLFFTLMLHLGTLAAVFIAYHKTIWQLVVEFFALVRDLLTRRFSFSGAGPGRRLLLLFMTATLPLIAAVPVKGWVTRITQDGNIVIEGLCFLFTALLLTLGARCVKGHRPTCDMTTGDALVIGLFQCLAILPGVSRSGSTISAGLLLGYSSDEMVSFSFLLGIPAVLGGCVLELAEVLQTGISVQWGPLLAGMLAAVVAGFFCIRLIARLVKTNRFILFAYYTVALGCTTVIAGIIEHGTGQNLVQLIGSLWAG